MFLPDKPTLGRIWFSLDNKTQPHRKSQQVLRRCMPYQQRTLYNHPYDCLPYFVSRGLEDMRERQLYFVWPQGNNVLRGKSLSEYNLMLTLTTLA